MYLLIYIGYYNWCLEKELQVAFNKYAIPITKVCEDTYVQNFVQKSNLRQIIY